MLEARCRKHDRVICSDCVVADDAARRAFDMVKELAVVTDWDTRVRQSPYLAIKLADGFTDGVLYDTKADAVRHVPDERWYAFFSFRNSPNGFASPRDAAIFLMWHRAAYERGMRLSDPDRDVAVPVTKEHQLDQLAQLLGMPSVLN